MNDHSAVYRENGNLEGFASALRESVCATKLALYSHDIYFMETWWALGAQGRDRPHDICRPFTYLLFKPDGLRRETVGKALAAMECKQFVVKHYELVELSRHATRALWQYDLNLATAERMCAVDVLFSSRQSLLVCFEFRGDAGGDAAQRAAAFKGPSRPTADKPLRAEHLRSVIGSWGGMLNFIHSPDDVWDFMRELAILVDRDRIPEVLSRLLSPARVEVDAVLATIDALNLAPELTPHEAHEQVASELAAIGLDLGAFASALRAGKVDWLAALGRLGALDELPLRWPHTIFAVHNTVSDAADTRTFLQIMSGTDHA
jgi:hypothetical protein